MVSIGKNTQAYYKLHSKIYDATRWMFLFGRRNMIDEIIAHEPKVVLEIGCGTGENIIRLKKNCPELICYGIDSSVDMLGVAKKKAQRQGCEIEWIEGIYPNKKLSIQFSQTLKPDLILCSYALSMFGEAKLDCLAHLQRDLAPGGQLAIVDFHETPFQWFRKWMKMNHVDLDGLLFNTLKHKPGDQKLITHRAFGGLWSYAHLFKTLPLLHE